MRTPRTMGTLLAVAAVAVLLISGPGCSRDPQNVQDLGKKIDLTLPKPGGRTKMPQKPTGTTETVAEKEAPRAIDEQDATLPAASKPTAAPKNTGKTKTEAPKKLGEAREAAAIGQRQRSAASMRRETGDDGGVDLEDRDTQPSEGGKLYQDSDNPLHPSYKKK